MKNKKKFLYFVLLIIIFILLPGQELIALELPIGLQKIVETNKSNAEGFLGQVSFPLVFIAGILSLLSPCILPTIPAFFAVSFKSKERIAEKTIIFFLGFASVFVGFGLIGASLGQTLGSLQINYSTVVMWSGVFLVILGLMQLLGKGFSSFWKPKIGERRDDNAGIYLFGASFGLGWTACLGPVLAGIILMASVMQNYLYSGLLLLTYAFGLFVPLFLLAIFFDKSTKIRRWLRGREIRLEIGSKVILTNTIQMLSGLLLIIIGGVFIIYKGTGIFNSWSFFGLKEYFYLYQNKLLEINISNWWLLILVIIIITVVIIKFKKRKNRYE
ncbi:MAG: cytochrome c biogenesis CcdA family protein [bacterium]|nr:cytochrome c biogenesis CcdA family protein [bacterium]